MRQNKRNGHKTETGKRCEKPAKDRGKKKGKGEQRKRRGKPAAGNGRRSTGAPATTGQFDDRISNPFREWEATGRPGGTDRQRGTGSTGANPDIEGMWVAACERRLMRFGNVPIVSRVDSISGSEGTRRPLYVLSSSTRMLGEKRDSSLDAFGMRTFASPMMLQPIGANNEMPAASGDGGITVYTDASHKGSSVGISAMFDPDDGGAYAYAGTLLVDTDLDGLINASESIAAISAVLAAIEKGYRRIRVMSDSSELIRMWNREMSPRRTVMRQLTVLHDIVDRNGIEVVMQHVYGHRSDFMNVAADGIAQVHERMSMESPVTGAAPEPSAKEAKPKQGTRKRRGKGKQEQPSGDTGRKQTQKDEKEQEKQPGQPGQKQSQPPKRKKTRRPGRDTPATQEEGGAESTSEGTQGEDARSQTPNLPEQGDTRRRRSRRKAQTPVDGSQEPGDGTTDDATPAGPRPQEPASPEEPRKSPNRETTSLANALHETEPKITLAKVSRCLERESYLNWPRVDAESGELIRSLMCDDDRRLPIAEIDVIWDAVAPNVAKGLEPRRRKHRTVIRAAVVARMCAASLKKTIDATRSLATDASE